MFRFTIRELLLLTIIVAMGLGWWLTYRAMEHRHARRSAYIEKLKERLRWELGWRARFDTYENRMKLGLGGMRTKAKLPPELENEP